MQFVVGNFQYANCCKSKLTNLEKIYEAIIKTTKNVWTRIV